MFVSIVISFIDCNTVCFPNKINNRIMGLRTRFIKNFKSLAKVFRIIHRFTNVKGDIFLPVGWELHLETVVLLNSPLWYSQKKSAVLKITMRGLLKVI